MVTAEDMAKHVIMASQAMGRPLDNLTLQNVLRELQDGGLLSEGLRFQERPQEWGRWSVYPQVYRVYSAYGGGPITMSVVDPLATAVGDDDERAIRAVISRWERLP